MTLGRYTSTQVAKSSPFRSLPLCHSRDKAQRGGALIDDIAFRQRLDEIERGIRLIRRTRDRDSQKVMLGFLLKDLDRLGHYAATAPRRHRTRFLAFEAEALALRKQIGEPVAPDAVPKEPVRRK